SRIGIQASSAKASSEPCMRLFISSPPRPAILMENSLPRCERRSSPPPPGMGVLPSRVQRFMLPRDRKEKRYGLKRGWCSLSQIDIGHMGAFFQTIIAAQIELPARPRPVPINGTAHAVAVQCRTPTIVQAPHYPAAPAILFR